MKCHFSLGVTADKVTSCRCLQDPQQQTLLTQTIFHSTAQHLLEDMLGNAKPKVLEGPLGPGASELEELQQLKEVRRWPFHPPAGSDPTPKGLALEAL